jgi:hypothetical protein
VAATEKVIRNLMHFASSDPEVTPPIRVDPNQVELGIISLERGSSKQNGEFCRVFVFIKNFKICASKSLGFCDKVYLEF